jgi:hypothetical protein
MIPFSAAYWHVKRRLADDQELPRDAARRLPMWRLLLGEVAWLARRLGRRR